MKKKTSYLKSCDLHESSDELLGTKIRRLEVRTKIKLLLRSIADILGCEKIKSRFGGREEGGRGKQGYRG